MIAIQLYRFLGILHIFFTVFFIPLGVRIFEQALFMAALLWRYHYRELPVLDISIEAMILVLFYGFSIFFL